MTDLSTLSLTELRELQAEIANQLKAREKDEIIKVQQEITRLAQSVGMTPLELMNMKATGVRKQSKPVAARYQNPNDATQQWTGRGRKPKWVAEYLEKSGNDLASLSIG